MVCKFIINMIAKRAIFHKHVYMTYTVLFFTGSYMYIKICLIFRVYICFIYKTRNRHVILLKYIFIYLTSIIISFNQKNFFIGAYLHLEILGIWYIAL